MIKEILGGLLLVALVVSAWDIWLDPYYHKRRVNFWEWAKLELIEELTGEREV